MSIVTSSKQSSVDLETAVKDFLRRADITVVPGRKLRKPLSKRVQAMRNEYIENRIKEHDAKLDSRG